MRGQVELAHILAPMLTREEFLAVYGISWVSHAFHTFGTEGLSDLEAETVFGSLGQEILHGMRILHRAGYSFRNLTFDDAECPRARDEYETCLGNLSWVNAIAAGTRFDYKKAVGAAIELVQGHALSIDLEPLKTAQKELRETLEAWRKDMTAEQAAQIVEERQKRMRNAAKVLNTGVN